MCKKPNLSLVSVHASYQTMSSHNIGGHTRAIKHVKKSQCSLYEVRISEVRKSFCGDPGYQTLPQRIKKDDFHNTKTSSWLLSVITLVGLFSRQPRPRRCSRLINESIAARGKGGRARDSRCLRGRKQLAPALGRGSVCGRPGPPKI
jgi:hypothetical protein